MYIDDFYPSFDTEMTCERHLEQAESNERAAHSVEHDYPDWAVTMCFYAALHWVEYYAGVRGYDIRSEYPHPSPHSSRGKYVKDLADRLRKPNLRTAYQYLERESRKARYLENPKDQTPLPDNANIYYTTNILEVTQSFNNLEKIKRILDC
ncbi:MAG: HEPN domain-containing protein [Iphinoe sp. HA4291-MV1]|nr:HEPN domain-containing protein [Iphinoe sp. HA4291-MV1]